MARDISAADLAKAINDSGLTSYEDIRDFLVKNYSDVTCKTCTEALNILIEIKEADDASFGIDQ